MLGAGPGDVSGAEAIRVTVAARTDVPLGRRNCPVTLVVTLDPEYQRILHLRCVIHGASSTDTTVPRDTVLETSLIEYGPVRDPSLFRLPLGPGVVCRYSGDPIQPAWERMTDTEQEQVSALFADLDRAVLTGDADLLLSLFDVTALPAMQAEGKASPERMRTRLRGWVIEQPPRFVSYLTRLDYVYGTPKPPHQIVNWHGVHRVRPDRGDVLVGLAVVSAQVRGEERPRRAPMQIMLRKSDGRYRFVGWQPPFG
jgi:hypothetical protein